MAPSARAWRNLQCSCQDARSRERQGSIPVELPCRQRLRLSAAPSRHTPATQARPRQRTCSDMSLHPRTHSPVPVPATAEDPVGADGRLRRPVSSSGFDFTAASGDSPVGYRTALFLTEASLRSHRLGRTPENCYAAGLRGGPTARTCERTEVVVTVSASALPWTWSSAIGTRPGSSRGRAQSIDCRPGQKIWFDSADEASKGTGAVRGAAKGARSRAALWSWVHAGILSPTCRAGSASARLGDGQRSNGGLGWILVRFLQMA